MITCLLMILYLAILEIALSVDNAIILASIVRTNLDNPQEQKKALLYGMWGAYIFRIIAVLCGVWLFSFLIVKIAAALYLIHLGVKYFIATPEEKDKKAPTTLSHFWKVIVTVELTDIIFSMDSLAVSLSISNSAIILILGAIIGITALRYFSTFFIKLLELFPLLESVAYLLVLLAGVKVSLSCFNIHFNPFLYLVCSFLIIMGYVGWKLALFKTFILNLFKSKE